MTSCLLATPLNSDGPAVLLGAMTVELSLAEALIAPPSDEGTAVAVAPYAPARLLFAQLIVEFIGMVLLEGMSETGPGPRSRVVVSMVRVKTGDIEVIEDAIAKMLVLGVELDSGQMVVLMWVRAVTYTVVSSSTTLEWVVYAARLKVPSVMLVVVMGLETVKVVLLSLT